MVNRDIVFKKYKCFKEETRLDNLSSINVFIGKNNIGKSSIIDIIGYINGQNIKIYNDTEICDSIIIDENIVKTIFSNQVPVTIGTGAVNKTEYDFAKEYINKKILRKIVYHDRHKEYEPTTLEPLYPELFKNYFHNKWKNIINCIDNEDKKYIRISAERDLQPEEERLFDTTSDTNENGKGFTSLITKFFTSSEYDDRDAKKELVAKFNEIMGEEFKFTDINTQIIGKTKQNIWEIFLDDINKRVALSDSGSGLKTILLILIATIIIPNINHRKLSDYVFSFEEIENNLHPSLLRRTIQYLEEVSQNGAQIFLTSHSNVLLDAFNNSKDVSIYEVFKENSKHLVKKINDYCQLNECLNELGVKASDLLQSNGIIWVEGPSDRIYINRWIELWGKGKYHEGMHYQCAVYGGKLLADMEFDENTTNELINLLNINRNSLIVMDSDKNDDNDNIRETKTRIIEECQNKNIFSWLTEGREIENYIPCRVFDRTFNIDQGKNIEQYQKVQDYLNKGEERLGDKYVKNKSHYSSKLSKEMTLEDMKSVLDLDDKMKIILEQIEKWNK